jgi:hypothetical protein
MSYFATLLQRSGVSVSESGTTAPAGASLASQSSAAIDPIGHAAALEQPAVRELHEVRVLPAHEETNERKSPRDTPTNAPSTAGNLDDPIVPREFSRARGDASAAEKTGTTVLDTSFEFSDRHDPGSPAPRDVPGTSDVAVGAQFRQPSDAPVEIAELGSRSALESPQASSDPVSKTIARALAEVRKWTSQTSMPSEQSVADEYTRRTAETPADTWSIEPRPLAVRDSTLPELLVSIGSIEVVVEEASAAPMPAARAAKSPSTVGASSSSRRLARHHLRG